MTKLNRGVLEHIKGELQNQGQELVKYAHLWQEESDIKAIEPLAKVVRELRGVTSILDLTGPTHVLTELALILDSDRDYVPAERNTIVEAATALANYLSFLIQRGSDLPLLVLPEINSLREISKKTVLRDFELIGQWLPGQQIVNQVSNKNPSDQLVVRRARHMFQQGLLHAIKGSSKSGAFRILGHAVRRIQQAMIEGSDEDLYWLMVLQVLDAFARHNLNLDKSRLRTLMAVERQMRQLMSENTDVANAYPPDTQWQLLTLFLLSGLKTDQAKKIAGRLGVAPLPFSEESIKGDRALFAAEGLHSFADTMSILKDELDSMSFFIDRLENSRQFEPIDQENLLRNQKAIAELVSLNGFALANQRFSEQVDMLKNLGEKEAIPEELAGKMVDSLLYLECLLIELNNRIPSEKQLQHINSITFEELVEGNIARHAQSIVLEESKLRLAAVMEKITDLEHGFVDTAFMDHLKSCFIGVAGAAQMLDLNRASSIAQRCEEVLTRETLERLAANPDEMAILADIFVSLEYYLDNCRWDMAFDPSVLTVADESLDSLSAA